LSQVRLLADVIASLDLFSSGELTSLRTAINAVNSGSQASVTQVKAGAAALTLQLRSIKAVLAEASLDAVAWAAIRENMLKQAARGAYSDFIMAEQMFLALDTLNMAINPNGTYQREVDAIFAMVKDESHFSPANFKQASQQFYQRLGK
jgi:hypothetical protein